jgi:MPBQ/MSBQ methyltransferase
MARKTDESFVATTDDYRNALLDEGFAIMAERGRKPFALDFFARMRRRNQQQRPQPLRLHLVMGEATLKLSNVAEGLRRG